MSQHPNAKLAPRGRETLVSRIEPGLGVAEAARQMGVSRQTAGKRPRRRKSGEGLFDRSRRPRRLARATPPDVEERVCDAVLDAPGPARARCRHGRARPHLREGRRARGRPGSPTSTA